MNPGGVELQWKGGLVEHAVALLAGGPRSTHVLASEVLGITANAQIAARTVWALLGRDPRFEVDAEGRWSLRSSVVPAEARWLSEEEWVIVDVETTGGSPTAGHRVTEIAAVRVAGGTITDTFSTLVNPDRRIPPRIRALTGISDGMVATAPRFREIAECFAGFLQGGIFVAHNAAFDWRFLSAELERSIGAVPVGRQLCTVRLARKLLPQLPSRSLDSLACFFDLRIAARHRALDDARATAELLLRLLTMLEEREITRWADLQTLLRSRSRAQPRARRRAMPHSMESA